MDIFVFVLSLVVPITSPLIGILVDQVYRKTRDSSKTLLAGSTIIYAALIAYSCVVFIDNDIIRKCLERIL